MLVFIYASYYLITKLLLKPKFTDNTLAYTCINHVGVYYTHAA